MRLRPWPFLLAAALAAPRLAAAFSNVAVGEPVRNREMPTLEGGKAQLLGSARANVFVFFRPDQDHSLDTLKQLADLERELQGKSVRFVAVTSDTYDRGSLRELVKEAGVQMTVLIDERDELYGELGVRLHPVTGIADERHRLAAYQHFLKINQRDTIRGRIRLLLGEITAAEMQRIVAPDRAHDGTQRDVAMRRVRLGRQLLGHGRSELAAEQARRALEIAPGLPEARALLAEAAAGAR